MNKELLLRGAELLEADAVNPEGIKFDLCTWAQDARLSELRDPLEFEHLRLYYEEGTVVPVDCRTQACAMGLFAISGAFRKDGLYYKIIEGQLIPFFGQADENHGYSAAAKLFDISMKDAIDLFSTDSYPEDLRKGAKGELEVANRIRQLVEVGN